MGIPIVIGVTGHRLLRDEDGQALREAVERELKKIRDAHRDSELVMLSSLAIGGDTICAQAALKLGIPLVCPLPMPAKEYREDFEGEDAGRFDELLGRARESFVVPATEALPENAGRDMLYRQAGIYIAAHCHILFALWDGAEGKSGGCGAAEAVSFLLNGDYLPRTGAAVRCGNNGMVVHILAPRRGGTGEAGTVRYLGDEKAVSRILEKTDEFNRLAKKAPPPGYSLFPRDAAKDAAKDPALVRTEKIYHEADGLSLSGLAVYRRMLLLLAAAGTMIAMAFLLYDEVTLLWMILLCGAFLGVSWGLQRYAVRCGCHKRYIEYRALAEGLRVQAFLRYAGSDLEASPLLSWSQQDGLAWIMDALCALCVGEAPRARHGIRGCWVEDQLRYHEKAGRRTGGKMERSERGMKIAFFASVAIYLSAVLFELGFGGLIFRPLAELSCVETIRTVLKIAVGTVSAGTLFAANYHGKLSLPRQTDDHEKMARFFAMMLERMERLGETEELLEVVAREELAENGNWYSYQQDNTPQFSL